MRRLQAGAVALSLALAMGAPGRGADLPAIGPAVTTLRLAGGGTGIVRPLSGAPVAALQLWFRAPSIGFGPAPQPGIARLAAYAIAASQPLTGVSLGSLVARAGGRFGISVYPQTVAISALVPASQASTILRAMSAVYFTPVLTDAGLKAALAAMRQDARLRAIASPEETLRDALFSALFASGPNHFSPAGDDTDPNGLGLDELRTFATRAFRAPNVTVVLTGNVDPKLAEAAVEGRSDGGGSEIPASLSAGLEKTPKTLMRTGPVSGFGYAWPGPPIRSEQEATALDFIADYLFNSDSGAVTRTLAGVDVAINAQYVTYYDPGVLFVEATGSQVARARSAIDAGLSGIRTPLDPATFAAARAAFEYHVLSDVSTPLSLADNFGWYASEGNAAYAPGADSETGRYVATIRALTPQFVAATAVKFLSAAPATVTLTAAPLPQGAPSPAASPKTK